MRGTRIGERHRRQHSRGRVYKLTEFVAALLLGALGGGTPIAGARSPSRRNLAKTQHVGTNGDSADGRPPRSASTGAPRRRSGKRATRATTPREQQPSVPPAGRASEPVVPPAGGGAGEPTVLPANEGTDHAGEAGWSPEALSRMKNNHFFRARRIDGQIQLNPITDPTAIDTQARPEEMIVQVNKADGRITVTSQGSGVRPNERAGFLNRLGSYDPQTGQFSQPGSKAPAANAPAGPGPVALQERS